MSEKSDALEKNSFQNFFVSFCFWMQSNKSKKEEMGDWKWQNVKMKMRQMLKWNFVFLFLFYQEFFNENLLSRTGVSTNNYCVNTCCLPKIHFITEYRVLRNSSLNENRMFTINHPKTRPSKFSTKTTSEQWPTVNYDQRPPKSCPKCHKTIFLMMKNCFEFRLLKLLTMLQPHPLF